MIKIDSKELETLMIECGGTYYDSKDKPELSGGIMISKIEIKKLTKLLNKKTVNIMDYERAWKTLKAESGYRKTKVSNIVIDRTVK